MERSLGTRNDCGNREIVSVIPQRSDQIKRNGKAPLDKRAYKRRSVIERCVNWLKENRHFSTRYDKLAVNFMGFVTLAFIRRYLRLLHPSDTPYSRWWSWGSFLGEYGAMHSSC